MRVTTWFRIAGLRTGVLLPILALAALPIFAQQQEQAASQQETGDAVADAARKAREQKKNAPKPKKVYTEDDVASKPAAQPAETPSGQPPTEGAAGTGQTAPSVEPAAAGGQKNDEVAWRKRFKEQRGKIAAAEKELDVMQRELDKSQIQYYTDPQKALMEQNSRKDVNDRTAKVDAKRKEVAQLKQGLSDLEDELRKAGGDPGWARE